MTQQNEKPPIEAIVDAISRGYKVLMPSSEVEELIKRGATVAADLEVVRDAGRLSEIAQMAYSDAMRPFASMSSEANEISALASMSGGIADSYQCVWDNEETLQAINRIADPLKEMALGENLIAANAASLMNFEFDSGIGSATLALQAQLASSMNNSISEMMELVSTQLTASTVNEQHLVGQTYFASLTDCEVAAACVSAAHLALEEGITNLIAGSISESMESISNQVHVF